MVRCRRGPHPIGDITSARSAESPTRAGVVLLTDCKKCVAYRHCDPQAEGHLQGGFLLNYTTESLTGRGSAPERLAHVHPQAGTDETDAPPDAGRPPENEAGPGEEAKPKRKKQPGGNYFTVCPHTFAKALALGIKPALALLTLARGKHRGSRTTGWSAEAIADC